MHRSFAAKNATQDDKWLDEKWLLGGGTAKHTRPHEERRDAAFVIRTTILRGAAFQYAGRTTPLRMIGLEIAPDFT